MRRAGIFAAAIMFALAASAHALGSAEIAPGDWVAVKSGQKVSVSGTLRLVGTGLFNDYVITDEAGHDWYVDKAERSAVKGNEHKSIAVEAVVTRERMTLADGTELEDRRVLKKIKVVVKD